MIAKRSGAGVLSGIRILDLSAWQAGPTVTMALADFGAEVIKIEGPGRLDGWRGGAGLLRDNAYERNPLWNAINRNKLGVSLDLKSEEGRSLFLDLTAISDVVVENFTPRVMDSLRLPYDVLRSVNEQIIMIALSGFGATGPWRDYSAFAFPTEEISGLTYLNGYPDERPLLVGQPVTDALAGFMGAMAVVAALHDRALSGHGTYIDLSQIEALTTFLSAELSDAWLNDRDTPRRGNTHPAMVPHGVYPCSAPGEWIALAARNDDEWVGWCSLIGQPGLASAGELATVTGRTAEQDRIDEAITDWSSSLAAEDAVRLAQEAGLPCFDVRSPGQLFSDDHLWQRGFFHMLEKLEVGTHPYPGAAVRLSETPGELRRAAPSYAQHNDYVFRELLRLSASEIQGLKNRRVISDEPGAQDWR